jgi:hypothetical protein
VIARGLVEREVIEQVDEHGAVRVPPNTAHELGHDQGWQDD